MPGLIRPFSGFLRLFPAFCGGRPAAYPARSHPCRFFSDLPANSIHILPDHSRFPAAKTAQTQAASPKISSSGHRYSKRNVSSAISRYPQEAGNSFPAISSAPGSIPAGNIIPDSKMEGRKIRMEIIEVFP